jgi:oxygen-independent coproporphyrinogen-3 oxidase
MERKLPPLSLYVHIPWCEKKCPYCDFNSHENFKPELEKAYIEKLIDDLDDQLHLINQRELVSIFIGGGTPSIFSYKSIEKLLNEIKKRIPFSNAIEITLEANPASSQSDYFLQLSETLVNRVSLGVQSFSNDKLAFLGRLHTREEALASLDKIKKHFPNFNLDLMFALQEQTLSEGLGDLKQALTFEPAHISWYQLTIEPNTVFYRNRPQLPEEELSHELYEQGKHLLEQYNFCNYEVSAYAKNEKQSIHNLNYWNFGDYLGIGAGAHGKLSSVEEEGLIIERYQKTRLPQDYLKGNNTNRMQKIVEKELPLEFLMNALRLKDSTSYQLFEGRTGLNRKFLQKFLEEASKKNLLVFNEKEFTKTDLGARYLDTLLSLI